jgi:hypothetical protein
MDVHSPKNGINIVLIGIDPTWASWCHEMSKSCAQVELDGENTVMQGTAVGVIFHLGKAQKKMKVEFFFWVMGAQFQIGFKKSWSHYIHYESLESV